MSEQQQLKNTADTILDSEIEIVINQKKTKTKKGFVNWIMGRTEDINITHRFALKPLSVGSLIRISKLVVDITPDLFCNKTGLLDCSHEAASKHGDNLVMVAAIAIQNKKELPSAELLDLVRENLTTAELLSIFQAVSQQIDVSSFMSSIISIRGVNLLGMNPKSQRGQIASGD